MRKSNVLTGAIVIVLIAVLLLAWLLLSKPARETPGQPTEATQTDAPAQSPERGADLEATRTGARSDVTAERERAVASPKKPELRIQVRYSSGLDEQPDELEVGISNRTGTLFKPQHVAPNEFVLAEAPPDAYIVAAKAGGFRSAVIRARLSAKELETKVTITLVPERSVLVSWRLDDGRPIKVGIADAEQFSESVRLEVYATKFRSSDAPPLDRYALGVLRSEILIDESENGARVAREKRVEWVKPEPIASTAVFGSLDIEEDGVIWASAFCQGVCVASLPIQPGQSEIEFVTTLEELRAPVGNARLVVLDHATGLPVAGAGLFVGGDKDGGGARSTTEGVLVLDGLPVGRHRGKVWTEGYRETNLSFTTRSGETVDLGTVRLVATHPCALFDVVAASNEVITGVGFELVELEDAADSTRPRPVRTATCESQPAAPNLRFDDVQRGRYLLRCNTPGFDCESRLVEPHELRIAPDNTPIAKIVVRAAGLASFVLDPPFAKGTQLIIESPAGHPLRELDVDEYGVAATDLLAGDYRLHLVEYGRATGSIDVRVDTNPFVFEIHR
jgi:hypothetical protein